MKGIVSGTRYNTGTSFFFNYGLVQLCCQLYVFATGEKYYNSKFVSCVAEPVAHVLTLELSEPVLFYDEARLRERSDRGLLLHLGKKASS